jgi:phosphatidylethanolamine-binding protein (PEBP) family uncharacterized protein
MLEKLPEVLGEALQGQRAGVAHLVIERALPDRNLPRFNVKSSAFGNADAIPIQYTADGDGISPPLEWSGVPDSAHCVVLIVEDADSPTPHPLVHAIVVTGGGDGYLSAGALPSADHEGGNIQTGLNSYLKRGWLPPDPPPGHGRHHYAFQLFALAEDPGFSRSPGRQELVDVIAERAVAVGCLVGTYERTRRESAATWAAEQLPRDVGPEFATSGISYRC